MVKFDKKYFTFEVIKKSIDFFDAATISSKPVVNCRYLIDIFTASKVQRLANNSNIHAKLHHLERAKKRGMFPRSKMLTIVGAVW